MPIVTGDKYIIIGEQEPHILKQGENITRIAKQTYGSRELAKYIIRFNNISNPDIVPVGTKLKIPKLAPNNVDLNKWQKAFGPWVTGIEICGTVSNKKVSLPYNTPVPYIVYDDCVSFPEEYNLLVVAFENNSIFNKIITK